jgi:AcrR family transcriptional regulator
MIASMTEPTSKPKRANTPAAKDNQVVPTLQTAKKRARRSQESRTLEAREKLLNATIEVLLECGYNKLSTKEVATRAGLSNGALVHHFRSKSELVVAATAAVFDEAILRARQSAQRPGAQKDPINGFISHCVSLYFDWPFVATLEVAIVARTEPELMSEIRPVVQNYRRLADEAWAEVLTSVGITRAKADQLLAMTVNVVRGMATGDIWSAEPAKHKVALSEWASFAKKMYLKDAK